MAARFSLRSYQTTNVALGGSVIGLVLLAAVKLAWAEEFLWAGLAVAVAAAIVAIWGTEYFQDLTTLLTNRFLRTGKP